MEKNIGEEKWGIIGVNYDGVTKINYAVEGTENGRKY